MTLEEFKAALNEWGQQQVPFLFWVDFELKKPVAIKLQDVDPKEVLFRINEITNADPCITNDIKTILTKKPVSFQEYQHKFDKVLSHLNYGDSFLTNLTVKTEIEFNTSLLELFHVSRARYKLLVKDQFLVFSPEIFIKIKDNKIFSYPMKGTIDASIPDATEIILKDVKEQAEHITIVDLIRNDLSVVSKDVYVSRFRYLEKIKTNDKDLLQVSSEITGTLSENYRSRLGDILVALLPAGSVSGAPKQKTVTIISEAEEEPRGYYTGVFGYFDGQTLDSGVMIRFIEKVNNTYFYRSGGGITTQSAVEAEYQELIDKVYVPID